MTPVVISVAIYFLYQQVGTAAFAGLAFLCVLVPINGVYLANKIQQQQGHQMQKKDIRLKYINEILNGIKVNDDNNNICFLSSCKVCLKDFVTDMFR